MNLLKVCFQCTTKKRESINATTKNETSSKINPFQQRRKHNDIIK